MRFVLFSKTNRVSSVDSEDVYQESSNVPRYFIRWIGSHDVP